MNGAALVALAAAVGNMLQGWDNATIAGAVLYIKREFNLQTQPTIEGLIVSMSLIGATVITTFSGPLSDSIGRRPMLIMSSMLYFLSGLVMFWAPNVYMLLLARLLDGFGIGLVVTLVPVYISETAPPDIRGLLNTLPQFTGCAGMFLSYCMVFSMSLEDTPNWRLMLGVLSIPSLLYFALAAFYLPESPRWLVSKGRMIEAKKVLQHLRGKEDVAGEMALLCEGLGSGGETWVEEYEVAPPDSDIANSQDHKDYVKLYGVENQPLVARPVRGQSNLSAFSRNGSQMVNLFGSIHEKISQQESMRSMLDGLVPSRMGSVFNTNEQGNRNSTWDEEREKNPDLDTPGNLSRVASDDHLKSPLLSRQMTTTDVHTNTESFVVGGEQISGMGIGGGWQLAYIKDENKDGELKRVYLHQDNPIESKQGSMLSLAGGNASAFVSKSVLTLDDITGQSMIGDATEQPSGTMPKLSTWEELWEPGVKHALVVGVGLQILQQFSGINGVLYYTPQILEQAGVGVLMKNLGLRSDSASFLISSLTTLLMLPSIGVAMRLMDIAGRRWLLLSTLPVLLSSLVMLVLSSVIKMSSTIHAVVSTLSVIVYFCTFVMGFGPVPNILCAEIFPTRVRGICIAICALTFWICDIIVTYSLPIMLTRIGLSGVFGLYAIVCAIAWVFVFLKVPETKGMPLEVITEFFVVGATKEDLD